MIRVDPIYKYFVPMALLHRILVLVVSLSAMWCRAKGGSDEVECSLILTRLQPGVSARAF